MTPDPLRNIQLATEMHDYRDFLCADWLERISKHAELAPRLLEITFDLEAEWKAAAHTASLPVFALDNIKGYHDSFVNTGNLNSNLLSLALAIPAKLIDKVPELSSDPELIRRLKKAILDTGVEISDARNNAKVDFPIDDMWKSCLETTAYKLSLWGSQRICFVAVYNSYENFLCRATCIARSKQRCRTTDKDFKKNLEETFGEKIREKCWSGDEMNIARVARHALSHAGGRLTSDLRQLNHGFLVSDDRIQVLPDKTKALFVLLGECVELLSEKAAKMPSFQ